MGQLNSHMFEDVYKKLDINLDTLGCVMADIEPLPSMGATSKAKIEKDLYYTTHPDRKWIDGWVAGNVAHVTLLYGLLENAHTWKEYVDAVLKGWVMDTVEIDHIGYFDSPYKDEDYYCLIAHLKMTPTLLEGHQRLEFLPHINTFTAYKAHMTVCYIKKDEAIRDMHLKWMNALWTDAKLQVKPEINLGYLPK